jgi:hypothetical protein
MKDQMLNLAPRPTASAPGHRYLETNGSFVLPEWARPFISSRGEFNAGPLIAKKNDARSRRRRQGAIRCDEERAGRARIGLAITLIRITAVLLIAAANFDADLDLETHRTRVAPIFLNKRPATRAASSATRRIPQLSTSKLTPGAITWSEEQSRRNFVNVSRLVVSGDPAASKFLRHPLAPEAGGDYFHGGGRQFASKQDESGKQSPPGSARRSNYGITIVPLRFGTSPTGMRLISLRVAISITETEFAREFAT